MSQIFFSILYIAPKLIMDKKVSLFGLHNATFTIESTEEVWMNSCLVDRTKLRHRSGIPEGDEGASYYSYQITVSVKYVSNICIFYTVL